MQENKNYNNYYNTTDIYKEYSECIQQEKIIDRDIEQHERISNDPMLDLMYGK